MRGLSLGAVQRARRARRQLVSQTILHLPEAVEAQTRTEADDRGRTRIGRTGQGRRRTQARTRIVRKKGTSDSALRGAERVDGGIDLLRDRVHGPFLSSLKSLFQM